MNHCLLSSEMCLFPASECPLLRRAPDIGERIKIVGRDKGGSYFSYNFLDSSAASSPGYHHQPIERIQAGLKTLFSIWEASLSI